MNFDIRKYKTGKWGMIVIHEEPIPDRDSLEWDSSDINSDDIPLREDSDVEDTPLWWTIIVGNVYTKDHYGKMILWCEENAEYMCGMRFDQFDKVVIGYFRHPDDALAFKWRWI